MALSEVHHSMSRYSKDVCHINRLFNLVYVTYNLVHHAQSTQYFFVHVYIAIGAEMQHYKHYGSRDAILKISKDLDLRLYI